MNYLEFTDYESELRYQHPRMHQHSELHFSVILSIHDLSVYEMSPYHKLNSNYFIVDLRSYSAPLTYQNTTVSLLCS